MSSNKEIAAKILQGVLESTTPNAGAAQVGQELGTYFLEKIIEALDAKDFEIKLAQTAEKAALQALGSRIIYAEKLEGTLKRAECEIGNAIDCLDLEPDHKESLQGASQNEPSNKDLATTLSTRLARVENVRDPKE